ncbi:toxin-antitoxin system YwqK family antitoxin [Polaribacter sp. IC073]|uniref:toxin-antitoxin system YwqK family antitoxin n=1 Tax=Polaribacter sp. IC073 TaxID=2508540 RepID=UPI0011BE94C0|nr:hypothetical protein [Polaribacter sp. IC073]TXD47936.1 hypothetical protein ES045_08885 [Polaribacter sp. IC073]
MKIILTVLCISFFSILHMSGQEKKWLDANGNLTTKEKAVYYTFFSTDKNKGQLVTEYYISGKKAKEFYFEENKKDGKYAAFYATGEVKVIGAFEEGFRAGMWKTYDKNGNIKEKGKYDKGEKVGVWKTFYKNN